MYITIPPSPQLDPLLLSAQHKQTCVIHWDNHQYELGYSVDGNNMMTVHATNKRHDLQAADSCGIVDQNGKHQFVAKFRPQHRSGAFRTRAWSQANMGEKVRIILGFIVATGQVQAQPSAPLPVTPIAPSRSAATTQSSDDAAASGENNTNDVSKSDLAMIAQSFNSCLKICSKQEDKIGVLTEVAEKVVGSVDQLKNNLQQVDAKHTANNAETNAKLEVTNAKLEVTIKRLSKVEAAVAEGKKAAAGGEEGAPTADDVGMTPTQPRAERASASNQSSVAFVKGQKVGYRRRNGNIESATIVGVHDDPSHPDKPFFTLGMPNGHEKQTEKERLVSITETAPPMSNDGFEFKTPQPQRGGGAPTAQAAPAPSTSAAAAPSSPFVHSTAPQSSLKAHVGDPVQFSFSASSSTTSGGGGAPPTPKPNRLSFLASHSTISGGGAAAAGGGGGAPTTPKPNKSNTSSSLAFTPNQNDARFSIGACDEKPKPRGMSTPSERVKARKEVLLGSKGSKSKKFLRSSRLSARGEVRRTNTPRRRLPFEQISVSASAAGNGSSALPFPSVFP